MGKKERDPEKEREEKEQSEGMEIIFYLRDQRMKVKLYIQLFMD